MKSMTHTLEPEPVRTVAVPDRIELLDVLRGFALLGMFIVHFVDFAQYQPKGCGEVTNFLFANKALSLFSLLFGIGFAVQMVRAEGSGRSFLPIYFRRMLVLFAIGAAHWCLIWGGSILLNYAIIGCILLLLRRAPVAVIVALAVLLIIPLLYQGLILRSIDQTFGREENRTSAAAKAAADLRKRLETAKQNGTYAEVVGLQTQRFRESHSDVYRWTVRQVLIPTYYFPMCLLGLAVVKSGLLSRLSECRTQLRRMMWCALLVGLASNPLPYLPLGIGPVNFRIVRLSFLLSGPALALAYACGLALALETARGRTLIRWLRWPGRMALTNYVGHTAVVIVIYYGFGLGLMKRVNVIQAWGMAIAVFTAFTLFSFVWLKRFEFGPLEWLWRALTYGRMPSRKVVLQTAAA